MKVFISYRRGDTLAFSGRLSDRLAGHFGPEAIVRDIDSIPLGADFAAVIADEIARCDVVLAIIGPSWTDRLSDPSDLVRLELEQALERNIPIVPVLTDETAFPRIHDLPDTLSLIVRRQAVVVRSGRDFHRDADVLIRAVEGLSARLDVPGPPTRPPDVDPSDLHANQVFVCHASTDRRWVEREIVRTLEQAGIRSWYSKTAIKTAAQWEREILRGLEKSDWFLIVLSPRAAASEWVKDELFWAMQYRLTRIVPVIMERTDLYQFHIRLARIHNIDFTEDLGQARAQLIEAVRE